MITVISTDVVGLKQTGSDVQWAKVVLECDDFSDLTNYAQFESTHNILLYQGSRAHVINTDTVYEMNGAGDWRKQKSTTLSLDADSINYDNTSSGMTADNVQDALDEINQEINTINDTDDDQNTEITNLQTQNTNQQQEIDYSINTGAKNIVNNTADATRTISGVEWTKNSDGSMTANGTSSGVSAVRVVGVQGSSSYASAVPIPRGTYTVSASGFDVTKYRLALGFFADENASRSVVNIYNEPYTLTVTSDTARYDFSCVIALSGEAMSGQTWYPMIRPSVISSSTYEPYAPSNRELYEMILQLQQTTGLRTMSLTRNIIPNEEITLDEEEVPEDEER